MSNPYETPQAVEMPPVFVDGTQLALASPWMRLVSQLIDMVIVMVVVLPVLFLTGIVSALSNARMGGNTIQSFMVQMGAAVLGLVIYIAVNWVFLAKGQTIGKKLMKLQIVRKNGQAIDRMRIITHRILPIQLVSQIPCLGGIVALVDALLIFRAERNTLHDDIADTKVIQLLS